MSQDGVTESAHARSWSGRRDIAREIFDSQYPERAIRKVTPQTLHTVIRSRGLGSSVELIELASFEQCRLLLDFDLWDKDQLSEERLWEWLELPDAANSLETLSKFIRFVDLKLIALIIARHVNVIMQEDPSEAQPGANFYSPDNGYTWLEIAIEDGTRKAHLGRLLALIFETDTELFYQLLSIPKVSTESMLEEQSFQDREKRTAAQGIPSAQHAAELHQAISQTDIKERLLSAPAPDTTSNVRAVQPLVYESLAPEPLRQLLSQLSDVTQFESEFTLLMNAAIVHWSVNFSEIDQVNELGRFVRGVINIGVERVLEIESRDLSHLYELVGLPCLYRFGLPLLFDLRKRALSISDDNCGADAANLALLEGLRKVRPNIPAFVKEDGSFEEIEAGRYEGGFRVLEKLSEVKWTLGKLESLRG